MSVLKNVEAEAIRDAKIIGAALGSALAAMKTALLPEVKAAETVVVAQLEAEAIAALPAVEKAAEVAIVTAVESAL